VNISFKAISTNGALKPGPGVRNQVDVIRKYGAEHEVVQPHRRSSEALAMAVGFAHKSKDVAHVAATRLSTGTVR
jgi:hypothetical protein